MFETMVHRTEPLGEFFCLFTESLVHTNTWLGTNTSFNPVSETSGCEKAWTREWLASPAPNLCKLRVHHLGSSHTSRLVYLAFINQRLASIHGLIGGPRLGFHHLQGLHAWEGRIRRLQSSASRQDHGAGLRQTGVHIHLRPGEEKYTQVITQETFGDYTRAHTLPSHIWPAISKQFSNSTKLTAQK